MSDKSIDAVRELIDQVDLELQSLLNRRAEYAQQIGEIKASNREFDEAVYYRPERESQILRQIRERNSGPLTADQIETLFREIISCCLSLEQPLTVAYLGPRGTFTETAAIRQFGHFADTKSFASIDEVFREVEAGSVHFGVVPVENSSEGMVNHTLDCFMLSNLKICAEIELPIHHCLLMNEGTDIDDLTVVYAHEQALAQCRSWLDRNCPTVDRRPVSSNAEAARIVAREERDAAIASERAAEQFQLKISQTNIEDEPDNTTRFLVVGQQYVAPSGNDKTSILVSTRNEPGALYSILLPFREHNISLSRLESRPSRTSKWTYVFFIDFDGHESSDAIQAVLSEVRAVSTDVKSLGSYPKALLQQ